MMMHQRTQQNRQKKKKKKDSKKSTTVKKFSLDTFFENILCVRASTCAHALPPFFHNDVSNTNNTKIHRIMTDCKFNIQYSIIITYSSKYVHAQPNPTTTTTTTTNNNNKQKDHSHSISFYC